jgi:hypothetical protein
MVTKNQTVCINGQYSKLSFTIYLNICLLISFKLIYFGFSSTTFTQLLENGIKQENKDKNKFLVGHQSHVPADDDCGGSCS